MPRPVRKKQAVKDVYSRPPQLYATCQTCETVFLNYKLGRRGNVTYLLLLLLSFRPLWILPIELCKHPLDHQPILGSLYISFPHLLFLELGACSNNPDALVVLVALLLRPFIAIFHPPALLLAELSWP